MKYKAKVTLGNFRAVHQIAAVNFSNCSLLNLVGNFFCARNSTKQLLGKPNQKATMSVWYHAEIISCRLFVGISQLDFL